MGALDRLFVETRGIDWLILIVDFFILVAILWLELPDWLHKRRAERTARALAPLMASGRQLQSSVPNQMSNPGPELMKWVEDVKQWSAQTEAFLAPRSARAAVAFTHVISDSSADRKVHKSDGSSFRLTGRFGDLFQVLQVQLDNLQKIMENPEGYF